MIWAASTYSTGGRNGGLRLHCKPLRDIYGLGGHFGCLLFAPEGGDARERRVPARRRVWGRHRPARLGPWTQRRLAARRELLKLVQRRRAAACNLAGGDAEVVDGGGELRRTALARRDEAGHHIPLVLLLARIGDEVRGVDRVTVHQDDAQRVGPGVALLR
eukprot:scaffold1896_cov121-Isochrysis_galbana.AAC.7